MEKINNPFKQKCFYIVLFLFIITCGLVWFSHTEYKNSKKLVEEVEYYDSLNNYNKIYYNKKFDELKKENKQLYDSLKKSKSQIEFLVQFTHEKEYETGKVIIKKDTIYRDSLIEIKLPEPKNFEYTSEPNDTFSYKLTINSSLEPNWYSIKAKTKNKFTIVNKQDSEDGPNHITIGSNTGGITSDVTVFHKKQKRKIWDRVSIGPSVTAGYDAVNKQWGIMAGASVTFDLTK